MNNILNQEVEIKSDFNYTKIKKDGITIIAIVDLDLGGMSVTNDIENVVEVICKNEKIDAKECGIIYKDTMGTWDGWNPENKWFIALSTKDKKIAINKIVKFKQSH